jgi:hypothetical protein
MPYYLYDQVIVYCGPMRGLSTTTWSWIVELELENL